ncbi:CamS family sex pheromone protein [Staphylococcus aureus]
MKRTLVLLITAIFILAACGNHKDDQAGKDNQKHNNSSNQVKEIATDKNVQGDNYRTLLPFKESQARGLLQDNMANSYNGGDFEDGLLNLSKEVFPTDKYLYQDGQFLDKKTINAYLNPKYTKREIDKMSEKDKKDKKANENLGLNPSHEGETDPEKIAEKSPAYLSNIKKEKDGPTFSKKLDDSEVKKQGKQMASEILSRLRENDDLKDIPIHFAIYKQSSEDSITPGEFITQATAEKSQTKLNEWHNINEKSALLPSSTAADYDENLNNNFKQFNDNLQSYFSNFTQAVGKVKFVDKKPQRLVVDLPIDYYGQAETIGITQYVTEQANKYFDKIDNYEIRIKDGNQPRALISKTKDDKEPQVHIYSN